MKFQKPYRRTKAGRREAKRNRIYQHRSAKVAVSIQRLVQGFASGKYQPLTGMAYRVDRPNRSLLSCLPSNTPDGMGSTIHRIS